MENEVPKAEQFHILQDEAKDNLLFAGADRPAGVLNTASPFNTDVEAPLARREPLLARAEAMQNYEQGGNNFGTEDEIISLRRAGEEPLDMDESLNDGNSAFSDIPSNGPDALPIEE